MSSIFAAAAALVALASPQGPPAQLKNENLLIPVPQGFSESYSSQDGGMETSEFVPDGEKAGDWSRMITRQVFQGLGEADPDMLPKAMKTRWTKACPDGEGQKLTSARENGYPVSIWMFTCPMKADAERPETMWLKAISGEDAHYIVQYAHRRPVTDQMVVATMVFLKQVSVCDTRQAEHPCPAGM